MPRRPTDGGNPETHVFDVDPDQSMSEAVVSVVAVVSDVDPLDLEPLYRTIDPDALDALYSEVDDDQRVRVTFSFSGYEVTVLDGDRIRIDGSGSAG